MDQTEQRIVYDAGEELKKYRQSEEYTEDFNVLQDSYLIQNQEIPPAAELEKQLMTAREEWLYRRRYCEENGHAWVETNVDGENGCNDLECESCGDFHHIQW